VLINEAAGEVSMNEPNQADTLFLAIRFGHTEQLREMLAANPALARAPLGGRYKTRTPLHVVTDWPGYFPNGPEIVRILTEAGADPDGRSPGDETPLHWAASSDDVDVAEALIDGGADLEVPDGSIGTPLDNAIGYGCWHVARLLVARGAKVDKLWHAAALGMMDRLRQLLDAQPSADEISQAFWHACSGAQRRAAELLLARGADLEWEPEYARGTALDAAMGDGTRRENVITWLRELGATSSEETENQDIQPATAIPEIATRIETAFATRDLDAFGALLAEDARWGDDDAINKCRSRADVLATFNRVLDEGADGGIEHTITGPKGVLCTMRVDWPSPEHGTRSERFWHAYLVSDGQIVEIRRYDDEQSALAAISE
jgi:hypothetical protein